MSLAEPDTSRDIYPASEAEARRMFTDAQRKDLAKKGHALADGSFPIENVEDLKNAIHAIGRAKDTAAAKAHIKRRAAALGASNLIPDSWKSSNAADHADEELRYALAPLLEVELRDPHTTANGSDDIYLDGYAAVFNSETTLLDGRFARQREIITPGAFDDILSRQPDVHLLIGHNLDYPMARTNNGTGRGSMSLHGDETGLKVRARLNPNITHVSDLAENIRDGVVDQMSFAFTVAPDGSTYETKTLADGREDTLRTIRSINQLYDVTVTPQGAYSQTSVAVRSLAGLSRRAAGTPDLTTPLEDGVEEMVTPVEGLTVLQHRHALTELRRRTHRLKVR